MRSKPPVPRQSLLLARGSSSRGIAGPKPSRSAGGAFFIQSPSSALSVPVSGREIQNARRLMKHGGRERREGTERKRLGENERLASVDVGKRFSRDTFTIPRTSDLGKMSTSDGRESRALSTATSRTGTTIIRLLNR